MCSTSQYSKVYVFSITQKHFFNWKVLKNQCPVDLKLTTHRINSVWPIQSFKNRKMLQKGLISNFLRKVKRWQDYAHTFPWRSWPLLGTVPALCHCHGWPLTCLTPYTLHSLALPAWSPKALRLSTSLSHRSVHWEPEQLNDMSTWPGQGLGPSLLTHAMLLVFLNFVLNNIYWTYGCTLFNTSLSITNR